MKIPRIVYHTKSTVMFVVSLVLFVLFFAITYTPGYGLEAGDGGETVRFASLWYSHQGLCLPVCCAIILVTTALSRTIMLLATRKARLREGEYLLWQFAEVVVTALFCNLFLSLYMHYNYFVLIPIVTLIYISVAIYPYTVYWLLAERLDRDLRIAEAQRTILSLRQRHDDDSDSTIRFADDKGSVKLVVSTERVLSIESSGNYITILYENAGRVVRYSLRNTMKGVEELCDQHRLVRCHRSWFVNLSRVRLLRKDPDGLYAEMDAEGVPDIPVSKSYASAVTERFAEKN